MVSDIVCAYGSASTTRTKVRQTHHYGLCDDLMTNFIRCITAKAVADYEAHLLRRCMYMAPKLFFIRARSMGVNRVVRHIGFACVMYTLVRERMQGHRFEHVRNSPIVCITY